ncbi:DUF2461 domain-containing protein [Pinibacter aurantiacus]|uniref:DUF2461 domain-containing protein n=1 Tax=Pinibacter aurantiacus TaxID=2851599 RepID=A0A9E2S5H4_9BACT|nr:DUF2461 domain-containing protein [Pinibacter aurantiacus]MBV4356126.1 DUF2461 domain-containing protein [Pinibacter aurantiacus]
MKTVIIQPSTLEFLQQLSKHNNREWFANHKTLYTAAYDNMTLFADALLMKMIMHDNIETLSGKKSLFRIYKDVRFSKEKTPYNIHWTGSFKRATKLLRGGYYYNIEPGNSFLAGGFWGPVPSDMKRIRDDIAYNTEGWDELLADKTFKKTFGKMHGEQLATAPRGYDKNHPAIELLRYKQFLLKHPFTDSEVTGNDFVQKANDVFKKMRPFLNLMSEILTTDANGEVNV